MRSSKRASDLKLMAVGSRLHSKLSRFASRSQRPDLHGQELEDGEVYPSLGEKRLSSKALPSKNYSSIEDPRVSRFSHSKILIIEKNLLMLTVLIFFMGMIKLEVETEGGEESCKKVLIVIDLANLLLIALIVLRKTAVFELEIDQKKIYLTKREKTNGYWSFISMLRQREYLYQLALEIAISIPHPSIFLSGCRYQIYSQKNLTYYTYSVNDLLAMLMLAKVYIIIRSLVALTIFSTPRALRICLYSGIDHDLLFTLKCLQSQYSLRCTTIIFGLSLFLFGYGFRVTEGQLSKYNGLDQNGFESFENCYWCAFITMATIGYGDYIPTTILARFLAISLAIIGVVLNSQLIMALSEYLKMKISESHSHTTLSRLHEQEELRGEAVSAFIEGIKITNLLTVDSLDPMITKKLKPNFVELKQKIDVAKSHHKRIKAIVPNQTITDEMIRSFELLKDSFKQIYEKQRKVKRTIERIEDSQNFRREEMRRSFIDSVSNIVTKSPRH